MEFTIKEVNVETGEEIIRNANSEELAYFAELKIANEAEAEAEAQKAADKAALLEKLGITEDEARLLLG
jgi:hypothetical protein